jgi:hypothetical protein
MALLPEWRDNRNSSSLPSLQKRGFDQAAFLAGAVGDPALENKGAELIVGCASHFSNSSLTA